MRTRCHLEMLELARFMRACQHQAMLLGNIDDGHAFAFVYHPEIAPILVAGFDAAKEPLDVIAMLYACWMSDDWATLTAYAASLGVTIIEGTLQ